MRADIAGIYGLHLFNIGLENVLIQVPSPGDLELVSCVLMTALTDHLTILLTELLTVGLIAQGALNKTIEMGEKTDVERGFSQYWCCGSAARRHRSRETQVHRQASAGYDDQLEQSHVGAKSCLLGRRAADQGYESRRTFVSMLLAHS